MIVSKRSRSEYSGRIAGTCVSSISVGEREKERKVGGRRWSHKKRRKV